MYPVLRVWSLVVSPGWLTGLLMLVLVVCGLTVGASRSATDATAAKADPASIEADNAFGFTLLGKLAAAKPDGNLIVSPPSVALALGMAAEGARGQTERDMLAALGVPDWDRARLAKANHALLRSMLDRGKEVGLRVANLEQLGADDVSDTYVQTVRSAYDAEVRRPPADADAINAWVSKQTEGKITRIVDPRELQALVMLLVNTVYFNGKWTTPFDEHSTEPADFAAASGAKTSCRMMRATRRMPYLENERLQLVRLPYASGRFSMNIVLPKPGQSPSGLVAALDARTWSGWAAGLKATPVALQLPTFRLAMTESLVKPLAAMGMASAFDSGSADFSGVLPGRAYISEVRHSTYLDVNEKGTEAAAATAVIMTRSAARPTEPPKQMIVNRPFLFVIRDDETGLILFVGQVTDPTAT